MKANSHKPILITGGRIFGGSGWDSPEWHEAVLVQDGKITEVGNYTELNVSSRSRDVIDLEGALLLPGLGDAHLHMSAGGKSLEWADIGGLNRKEASEILLETEGFRDENGKHWVIAFNWEPSVNPLDREFLDQLRPDSLVLVNQRDLHGGCCCSELLHLAGITRDTPDPPSGRIGKGEDGMPNGRLFESAIDKVWKIVPEGNPDTRKRFILNAQQYLLEKGLTAVSEVLNRNDEPIYVELDRNGDLALRIDAWRRIEQWQGDAPPGDGNRLSINTLKCFLDGSFGSLTAALEDSYSNSPGNRGILVYDDKELADMLIPAVSTGWRIALHAIGDRAVSQALRVIRAIPADYHRKIRIEHLQLLSAKQVQEAASMGIIASIQPVHMLEDQIWLPERIGEERCLNAFRWQSLLSAGVPLALGSDWPVAEPDPFLNIHVAINQCGFGMCPSGHFSSNERLSPYQSIRAVTYGWAYAAGMDNRYGAIIPGNEADFTIVEGISDDFHDWSEASLKGLVLRGVFKEV